MHQIVVTPTQQRLIQIQKAILHIVLSNRIMSKRLIIILKTRHRNLLKTPRLSQVTPQVEPITNLFKERQNLLLVQAEHPLLLDLHNKIQRTKHVLLLIPIELIADLPIDRLQNQELQARQAIAQAVQKVLLVDLAAQEVLLAVDLALLEAQAVGLLLQEAQVDQAVQEHQDKTI